jgi:mono/diheme cytochrome c family protein
MISAFMRRPAKVILRASAVIAVSAIASACGTMGIKVPRTQANAAIYHGAVLFSQRCSGCHTLSYAGTQGSASNVRTREITNGPNFNVRCERPVTRVLYAIENGGFSGAIMPQNVVVGQDARDVAQFVATYAGRQATKVVGTVPCASQTIGTLPAPASATTTTSTSSTTSSTTSSASSSSSTAGAKHAKPKKKKAHP